MEGFITVIVVLIFIGNCNGYTYYQNESIFIRGEIHKYCDMKCGNLPHTLCMDKHVPGSIPPRCHNFRIYDNVEDDLLLAINGLRDRIAYKMKVSNMVSLKWNAELGDMANAYLRRCTPLVHNPCTDLGAPDETSRDTEPHYYHVSGVAGFRRIKFKPHDLVSSIVRDWYYGKNYMDPPKLYETDYGDDYGILLGHNNFTHLADPRVAMMGCGLARLLNGYGLICYFFPYFTSPNITFYRGEPASNCPNRYPLRAIRFNNLCTAGVVQWGLDIKVLFICIMIVWVLNTYGYRMFRLRVQGGLIFWQKWNW